jgi:serine protease SohB
MFWDLFTKEKSVVELDNLNSIYYSTVGQVEYSLTGKRPPSEVRKRHEKCLFVIDFNGDVMATQAKGLTHEITTILLNAQDGDEVLIRLESPGGAAHAYGYAASQIDRLKKKKVTVTVAVDSVAASGGYMMACVANKIIAAPYSIIGSIGVVSEFPNFFKLLTEVGVEYKQYTAGKFKRTVGQMGPITEEGETKFKEDLIAMYDLFKGHVSSHRPALDIERVATGEHWNGVHALELGLVDEILTSEEFIIAKIQDYEILKVSYIGDNKKWYDRVTHSVIASFFQHFSLFIEKKFMNSLYSMAKL